MHPETTEELGIAKSNRQQAAAIAMSGPLKTWYELVCAKIMAIRFPLLHFLSLGVMCREEVATVCSDAYQMTQGGHFEDTRRFAVLRIQYAVTLTHTSPFIGQRLSCVITCVVC